MSKDQNGSHPMSPILAFLIERTTGLKFPTAPVLEPEVREARLKADIERYERGEQ